MTPRPDEQPTSDDVSTGAGEQARRDGDERRDDRGDDTEEEMAEADTAYGERRPDDPDRG